MFQVIEPTGHSVSTHPSSFPVLVWFYTGIYRRGPSPRRVPHPLLAGFRSASLGLRLYLAGSPRRQAVSSLLSYGLAVHLPLLSTTPRGDAVMFSYRVQTNPDRDFHPADSIPLHTH